MIQVIDKNKVNEGYLRRADTQEVRSVLLLQQLKRLQAIKQKEQLIKDAQEIDDVLRLAKGMRSHHRTNRRGYDKETGMRDTAMIPNAIYWNPRYKHIFQNDDAHESQRLRRKFFKTNHKLMTVDKL